MSALGKARTALRSGPMGVRSFRLLAAGQFTSTAGDYCYAVALPWLVLATHSHQSGPVLLGIVLACYGVSRTVLIPVGGIVADRIGPRRVMLAADVVRCGLVALLAAFAAGRLSSVAVLGPVAALIGAGEGLFLPASYAVMPTLIEDGQLAAGNAVSQAMMQAGSLIGPALGGILVATAGPAPAFAVDAATFAVSAVSLAFMTARRPAGAPEPVRAGDTAPAGAAARAQGGVWQLLRTSRFLQVLLVVAVVANLSSGGTFEVALPSLAHDRFGAAGYGALLACLAAGAVAGTLYSARAAKYGRPAVAACVSYLVMSAAIGLVPFLGGLPGAAAAVLVFGMTNGFGNTVFFTLLQRWAPGRLLGQLMSVLILAMMGIFPLSVAVSGVLVRHLGPSPFFPVAAILVTVTILGALTQREVRDFGVGQTATAAAVPDEARTQV